MGENATVNNFEPNSITRLHAAGNVQYCSKDSSCFLVTSSNTLISSAGPDDTLGTLRLLTRYLKTLEKDHSFGKSEEVVSDAITYISLLHKNYKRLSN